MVASVVAQESLRNDNDRIRRLRFRRPRPKSVDDEEGIRGGRPVPLRAQQVPQGKNIDNQKGLVYTT